MLWANSAEDKLMKFLFFLENTMWHFMQIVSLGDNLLKCQIQSKKKWELSAKIWRSMQSVNFIAVS